MRRRWVGAVTVVVFSVACRGGDQRARLCVPWEGAAAGQPSPLERSSSFLPSPSHFVDRAPRDLEAEEIHARLKALGAACASPYLPVGGTNAFGSHVNALVYPLAYGLAYNRTALTPPLGAYANGSSCDTFACFFRPLAAEACGAKAYGGTLAAAAAASKALEKKCKVKWSPVAAPRCDYDGLKPGEATIPAAWRERRERSCCGVPVLRAARMKRGEFSPGERGAEAIPEPYRGRGQLWFVAQVLHWLLRPNDATVHHVQAVADRSGLSKAPRPMVAIHVRRGDSCRPTQEANKARRCTGLDEYWYHALAMRATYGVKSVFLATDDAAIAADAKVLATEARLPIFFSLDDEPAGSSDGRRAPASDTTELWDNVLLGTARASATFDAEATVLGVVTDLLLLARADAFVGKFTSNLDRVAYALMVARSRCLKPVVSLDSLWCHDWSNKVGKSLFGTFLC